MLYVGREVDAGPPLVSHSQSFEAPPLSTATPPSLQATNRGRCGPNGASRGNPLFVSAADEISPPTTRIAPSPHATTRRGTAVTPPVTAPDFDLAPNVQHQSAEGPFALFLCVGWF